MSRIGDWFETFTGRRVYPLDPQPEDFDIEDIAQALAKLCRFCGHCKFFYSVGQHSYHVSYLTKPENALYGLLHDASEAYISDLVRPFKKSMPEYKVVEEKIEAAVALKFGYIIDPSSYDDMKQADNKMLITEAFHLTRSGGVNWDLEYKPLDMAFGPWSPDYTYVKFMERFKELTCPKKP